MLGSQAVLDISVGVHALGGQGTLKPVNKAGLRAENKRTFILHLADTLVYSGAQRVGRWGEGTQASQ